MAAAQEAELWDRLRSVAGRRRSTGFHPGTGAPGFAAFAGRQKALPRLPARGGRRPGPERKRAPRGRQPALQAKAKKRTGKQRPISWRTPVRPSGLALSIPPIKPRRAGARLLAKMTEKKPSQ